MKKKRIRIEGEKDEKREKEGFKRGHLKQRQKGTREREKEKSNNEGQIPIQRRHIHTHCPSQSEMGGKGVVIYPSHSRRMDRTGGQKATNDFQGHRDMRLDWAVIFEYDFCAWTGLDGLERCLRRSRAKYCA